MPVGPFLGFFLGPAIITTTDAAPRFARTRRRGEPLDWRRAAGKFKALVQSPSQEIAEA
jgi:hypothetical protein